VTLYCDFRREVACFTQSVDDSILLRVCVSGSEWEVASANGTRFLTPPPFSAASAVGCLDPQRDTTKHSSRSSCVKNRTYSETRRKTTVTWRQPQSRARATRVAPVDGTRFSTQPSFSVASAGEHLGPQLNATRTFDRGACVKNCRFSDIGRSNERFLTSDGSPLS
jgi:hypothetical protein